MKDGSVQKVIIVEGKSDKKKVALVLNEEVDIICTNGTLGIDKLDELVDELYDKEVYLLADGDRAGDKLRQQFTREFPQAVQLYIDRKYREVEAAPNEHIASILLQAHFQVHVRFLEKG